MSVTEGFVPPAYPYERLDEARARAALLPGGAVDCSIGAPCDPPPPEVIAALSASGSERGYPPSIGSPAFREAAVSWVETRLGVSLDPDTHLAACIGSKEFVVSLPHHLKLRRPEREPAFIFFLLIAPVDSAGPHLKALARISRLLKDKYIRESLKTAQNDKNILAIVQQEDGRLSSL